MRILRWRVAGGIVALLFLVAYLYFSGSTRAVIQVDFNYAPELEGAVVHIDGDSVGTLFRHGRQHLTGFYVKLGPHTVSVLADGFEERPVTVEAELRGMQYVRYAFPDRDGWGPDVPRFIALTERPPG